PLCAGRDILERLGTNFMAKKPDFEQRPPLPSNRRGSGLGGSFFIWLLLLFVIGFLVWNPFGGRDLAPVSYTAFRAQLKEGNVEELAMTGDRIAGKFVIPVERGTGSQRVSVRNFETFVPSTGDEELL